MDVDIRETRLFPWVVGGLILFLIASAILVYRQIFIRNLASAPTTYEECAISKGSIIQESYPATCVSASGARFTQPLTDEEQNALESLEETADWVMYTNTEHHFTLKYPPQYEQRQDIDGWPNSIVIISRPERQSYDLVIEIWNSESEYREKYDAPNDINSLKVFPMNNEKYVTLFNVNGNPEIEQILSTFKILPED